MNKKSSRKLKNSIRNRVVLIEERGDEGTKWYVSVNGPALLDRGSVELVSEREALKLIQLITELIP